MGTKDQLTNDLECQPCKPELDHTKPKFFQWLYQQSSPGGDLFTLGSNI